MKIDKIKINKKMLIATFSVIFVVLLGISLTKVVDAIQTHTIVVKINDSRDTAVTSYSTKAKTVAEFIAEENIDFIKDRDKISLSPDSEIKDDISITIDKAIDIKITADGQESIVTIIPTTVDKTLEIAGITIDEDDIVNISPSTVLRSGDSITITRVDIEYEEEFITTPFSEIAEESDYLFAGEYEIIQEGIDHIEKETYKIIKHDGVEISRELSASEIEQEGQDEITALGTRPRPAPVSNPSLPYSPGTSELGFSYTSVMNARAVAYTAPPGSHGAYGGLCTYGTVAVDPTVIPLGTKLYIEGYGYAYANDVGSGVKGNIVDLFMESIDECYAWGSRYVNVYILN